MTHPIKAPKKLIEVSLPLDAINTAAAKEKSIRHGHPSTLHLWWARATSWEGIEGEANAVPDLAGQLDLFGGKK